MCGAFSLVHPFREIGRHYNAGYNELFDKNGPRYNIRPGQLVPVVMSRGRSLIQMADWGIESRYGKDKKMFLINARDDKLDSNFWQPLAAINRCLIPADGFYEWKLIDKTKQPYFFSLKSRELFSFAGIWQMQKNREGKLSPHFVIITTEPNKEVSKVHNRMPVILTKETETIWLSEKVPEREFLKVLKPFSEDALDVWPVSTLVNNPKYDTSELVEKL